MIFWKCQILWKPDDAWSPWNIGENFIETSIEFSFQISRGARRNDPAIFSRDIWRGNSRILGIHLSSIVSVFIRGGEIKFNFLSTREEGRILVHTDESVVRSSRGRAFSFLIYFGLIDIESALRTGRIVEKWRNRGILERNGKGMDVPTSGEGKKEEKIFRYFHYV